MTVTATATVAAAPDAPDAPRPTVAPARCGEVERRWSFRPGVVLHTVRGDTEIEHPWGRLRLAGLGSVVQRGLFELAGRFVGDEALLGIVAGPRPRDQVEVVSDLARLHQLESLDCTKCSVVIARNVASGLPCARGREGGR